MQALGFKREGRIIDFKIAYNTFSSLKSVTLPP